MPLVKGNTVVADEFIHLTDDAPLPADGAVLLSAERFLADPEAAFGHNGKTGVIWPNNRDIDDLLPYLDRLAVIALVFPIFRDGRAYSQAVSCASATSSRASCAPQDRCCATSSCSCCARASMPLK